MVKLHGIRRFHWILLSCIFESQPIYNHSHLKVHTLRHGLPPGSVVKNLPAMQAMWVWCLSMKESLEKEMATHSSILAWRIPWIEEPGGLESSPVQSFSRVRLFVTPRTTACQASLSITNSWVLIKLMSTESVLPSNHLILCRPLLLPPSIFPSIRVFSNESALCIRWPKYWSFSFSISPSNEYSGLISFRMDWSDLLVVPGTLKNLLQQHSSKASILQCSAFFIVQLSHPYMTTGKTIALTRQTFAGKVMSLLFNMLSRLVITFLPRSKSVLISWLQSSFAVILEQPKIKSVTVSPSICHEVMGPDAIGSKRAGCDWSDWACMLRHGEGNGKPLQYSCLENAMDRVWQATVHGISNSQMT